MVVCLRVERESKMCKRIILLLLMLPTWTGCDQKHSFQLLSKEFAHSGCASGAETKADNDVSLLILKYEEGNLRVTRTNAMMNCSIKQGGLPAKYPLMGISSTIRSTRKMVPMPIVCAG